MTKGIYKIINKVTNKYYIGSSIEIENRLVHHTNQLKGNRHCNIHLQNAWNKYNPDNFEFTILEELPDLDIVEIRNIEQQYLDNSDWDHLYNIAKNVEKPCLNRIFSKETREKISKANTGRTHSEETKLKIGLKHKGKIISDHAKEVARQLKTGITVSKETREKISKSNRKSGSSVYFHKTKNKWISSIYIDNKNKHLGNFDTYQEALEARLEAERIYW